VKLVAVAVAIAALATAGAASSARLDHFTVRAVASDRTDPKLVNAWGLAASPTGPWWVANEAKASSTLYDGSGRKQALDVQVIGGPQGVVYYGGRGFVVRQGRAAGPARFLYACEDGTIRASGEPEKQRRLRQEEACKAGEGAERGAPVQAPVPDHLIHRRTCSRCPRRSAGGWAPTDRARSSCAPA